MFSHCCSLLRTGLATVAQPAARSGPARGADAVSSICAAPPLSYLEGGGATMSHNPAMPANVEIKARIPSVEALLPVARAATPAPEGAHGAQAAAVFQPDVIAVAAVPAGEDHRAVADGIDRLAALPGRFGERPRSVGAGDQRNARGNRGAQ